MTRLTPERLQKIREEWDKATDCRDDLQVREAAEEHIPELFQEIDALLAELDLCEKYGRTKQDVELIAEISKRCMSAEKERDQLKIENELLKQHGRMSITDRELLLTEEIDRLRESKAKLRESCKGHLHTMTAINQHMGYNFTQPLFEFQKALAQDDEMEKKG